MSNIIDLKFKDMPPSETVKRIQAILEKLNIEVTETWYDSGIEDCHSLSVSLKDGFASSNGKGITKELAQASAYAEFIERLQMGLHYYKLQSQAAIPGLELQTYAPDGKYMTLHELEENGDWMDHLIRAYGSSITRKRIAKLCQHYACTEEDKILTIPFYSIFEDKYVYLPAGFVNQMYTTNGCCAGNTAEEAIVHAISEIFERNCNDKLLASGFAAPKLPDSLLHQFPTVSNILAQLQYSGDFDVTIFDISYGNDYPAVATRIIDKRTHNYIVNAAADPVLEIALQRTLTESFQGRTITSIRVKHDGEILNKITDKPLGPNLRNMRENSSGIYPVDFFCEPEDSYATRAYPNNYNKSNSELLTYALEQCKKLNKPLYIRNCSFLGFTCYKVIIPGFSEGFWPQLTDPAYEYALGNEASKIFRNITAADKNDLSLLILYTKKVSDYFGVRYNFSRLSGIPFCGDTNFFLTTISIAHAYYMINKPAEALECCEQAMITPSMSEDSKEYLSSVAMYLRLVKQDVKEQQIRTIIKKFTKQKYAEQLYSLLDSGKSPFDNYLLNCNYKNCNNCKYSSVCTYNTDSAMIRKVTDLYNQFTDGQGKANFPNFS